MAGTGGSGGTAGPPLLTAAATLWTADGPIAAAAVLIGD